MLKRAVVRRASLACFHDGHKETIHSAHDSVGIRSTGGVGSPSIVSPVAA
jgi:hypothetical protein